MFNLCGPRHLQAGGSGKAQAGAQLPGFFGGLTVSLLGGRLSRAYKIGVAPWLLGEFAKQDVDPVVRLSVSVAS